MQQTAVNTQLPTSSRIALCKENILQAPSWGLVFPLYCFLTSIRAKIPYEDVVGYFDQNIKESKVPFNALTFAVARKVLVEAGYIREFNQNKYWAARTIQAVEDPDLDPDPKKYKEVHRLYGAEDEKSFAYGVSTYDLCDAIGNLAFKLWVTWTSSRNAWTKISNASRKNLVRLTADKGSQTLLDATMGKSTYCQAVTGDRVSNAMRRLKKFGLIDRTAAQGNRKSYVLVFGGVVDGALYVPQRTADLMLRQPASKTPRQASIQQRKCLTELQIFNFMWARGLPTFTEEDNEAYLENMKKRYQSPDAEELQCLKFNL